MFVGRFVAGWLVGWLVGLLACCWLLVGLFVAGSSVVGSLVDWLPVSCSLVGLLLVGWLLLLLLLLLLLVIVVLPSLQGITATFLNGCISLQICFSTGDAFYTDNKLALFGPLLFSVGFPFRWQTDEFVRSESDMHKYGQQPLP